MKLVSVLSVLMVILPPMTSLQNDNKIRDDPLNLILFITLCTPDDITDGDGCTMSCSVDLAANYTSGYQLNGCTWKYYNDATDLDNPNVIIFDGVSTVISSTQYAINLQMTTYNAGQYVCFFDISYENVETLLYSNPITIDQDVIPVYLDEQCTASTQCLALNSVCSGSTTCQCPPGDIKFNDSPSTPACLASEPVGGNCNIEEECVQDNQDIHCDNNVCTCRGIQTYVAETGEMMCIDSEWLTDSCVYDEQCTLCVEHSVCDNGICKCAANYYMSTDGGDKTNYTCELVDPFDLLLDVIPCTASDFNDGDGCIMICTVKLNDMSDPSLYQLKDWNWAYGEDSSSPSVSIYDQVTHQTSSSEYLTSITLDTYNSGQYVCQFVITYDNETQLISSYPIIINPQIVPVYLNQDCAYSSQCLALNSICTENGNEMRVCQCPDDHNIPYNNQNDTPACLTHVPFHGSCNIDEECAEVAEDMLCICSKCLCGGLWMDEPKTGEYMCLNAVYLTENCVADGQCVLDDIHSHCQNGTCQCNEGYTLDNTGSDMSSWYCKVADQCFDVTKTVQMIQIK